MRWFRALTLALGMLLPSALGTSTQAAFNPFPSPQCTGQLNVSQTTGTDLRTFTNGIHICFVFLISATAQNINLIAGTGTVCATSPIALMGGTTAATGPNLAANSGFVLGTGFYPISETSTTAQHLCLLQSGAGQVSGIIRYIDQ